MFAMSDPIPSLLHQITHHFRRRMSQDPQVQALGLSPMQGRLLQFVGRHQPTTASAFSEHSRRDRGQVTRLLSGMVKQGLILREVSPQDGRVHLLSLSPEGARTAQTLRDHKARVGQSLVQGLDAAEREALAALLTRLRDSLEA